MTKVLVIQFPGVNCEYESMRACEAVGLSAEIRRWNDATEAVKTAPAIIVPGGWSYQDRLRAGVVAAKERVLDGVAEAADRGTPVLGICNGAQILVEAGIVPSFEHGSIEVALAPNRMTGRHGYYCNWVYLKKGPASCVFTESMTGEAVPIPLAHAEGRFVTGSDAVESRLLAGEGIAISYSTVDGHTADSYPENPNGSSHAIAGLCNPAGNALAMMPHPERAAWLHQVPLRVGGRWAQARADATNESLFGPGPGRAIFESLKRAVA